ncbi:MAG: hypothetical protein KGJ80_21840, partial [Chloroflexota bacterium]|nr:hypothetical protein [Chloroflexota bacterium]
MKRFAQIVGLLLGVFLLAGVLPENGDSGLARITYLRASAVIGNSSSLATDPPASFSLSPGDTPAPNSTTSNPLSAGDGHIRLVSSVLPDDTVERDLKSHARPSPTVLANAAVPVLPLDGFDLYIHFPTDADQRQPLRVVVALHGMGSRGDVFAQSLVAEADQNGWLLVAPTLPYGDYMDPTRLAEE